MEIKRFFAITGIVMPAAILTMMLAGFSCFPAILLVSAVPLVVCALKFRQHLLRAFAVLLATSVAIISFCIRYTGVYQPSLKFAGQELTVEGTAKDYESDGKVVLKNCTIGGDETKLNVTVYLDGSYGVEPGDTVKISATEIRSTEEDGNVFLYHTLSGRAWLSCSAYYKTVETEKSTEKSPFLFILKLRHNISEKLGENLTEDSASIATALITGDKSGVTDELTDAMRYAGISHIFAVSGMHLSIWCAVIFLLFGRGARHKKIPLIVSSVFVAFYMVFTGLSPSVMRAGIMLLTVFLGGLIRRKADALNSLGFAVTVLLCINPFLAGNVSFLLSSLATLAIIKLYPVLAGDRKKSNNALAKKAESVKGAVLTTFSVLLLTLPVCTVFFGYMSILSPVSSLVCTPVAEGIMITAAVGLILPSKIAAVPFTLCEALSRLMKETVTRFASVKTAVCPLDKNIVLPWFILSAAAFIIIYFIVKEKKRQALCLVIISSALCLVSAALIKTAATKDSIEIYMPYAGSSTSIAVIDESGGNALLIGAGGDYYSARDLKSRLSAECINGDIALIVPRDTDYENGNSKYIYPIATSGTATVADSGYAVMGKNCQFNWNTSGDGSYGVLEANGKKIVIIFYPSGDYSGCDIDGDILLCRAFIPGSVDAADYEQIIVMSSRDSDFLNLPDNAVSTKDTDGFSFTVRAE